jgi:spore coat polysaccharide biosynthesis protein SpsF
MKTLAVVTARMASSRLPRKVMLDICGKPIIERICDRLKLSRGIDEILVATTIDQSDNEIVDWCKANGTLVMRGPVDDVLHRMTVVSTLRRADKVIRITCDLPFISYEGIDDLIAFFSPDCDYANNIDGNRTWQDGTNAEIAWAGSLRKADSEAYFDGDTREHGMLWLRENNSYLGQVLKGPYDVYDLKHIPLMVDTEKDLAVARFITAKLDSESGYDALISVMRKYRDDIERIQAKG